MVFVAGRSVLVLQVGYIDIYGGSGGWKGLLVDLGQELVVAEKVVLVFADLDGAAAEL